MKTKKLCVRSFPLQLLHLSSLLNKLGNAYLCICYTKETFLFQIHDNITPKYVHVTNMF